MRSLFHCRKHGLAWETTTVSSSVVQIVHDGLSTWIRQCFYSLQFLSKIDIVFFTTYKQSCQKPDRSITKRKFKEWWSTISPISTKWM